MRTANPALSERAFTKATAATSTAAAPAGAMTVDGTIGKTALLLGLVVASGAVTWTQGVSDGVVAGWVPVATVVAALVGLVIALIAITRPTTVPVLGPVYGLVEGVLVGGVSAIYELQFDGIVLQAAGLTAAVLAAMLIAYRTRLIQVTARFRSMVVAATGAILIAYLVSFGLGLFGVQVPGLHSSGPLGIVISLVIVGVAALNLVLDFDIIERGVRSGAPKHMEWYGAFGLVVTLVWLYLELLRLLSKLQRR